jgi:flagellar biosynthesis chaperone FliJ
VSRQLETEAADRAKLAAQYGAAQDQLQAVESQRQAMVAQLAEESSRSKSVEEAGANYERMRKDLEAKIDAASKVEKTLRQQVADQERAVSQARGEAESSSKELRRLAAELEQAKTQAESARAEGGQTSREQAIKAASMPLDWLLAAFQKLATSDSLNSMLTNIVESLANDFPRVMLFNVNGSRLDAQHQRGFSFKGDLSKIGVPLGTDSLLARAVTSCRIQGASASELSESSRKLFGGKPSFVLVMPVAVRKKTLAVIYADDSGQSQTELATPERKAKFAQLLLWQAIPRLPKLLNEGKAPLAEAG